MNLTLKIHRHYRQQCGLAEATGEIDMTLVLDQLHPALARAIRIREREGRLWSRLHPRQQLVLRPRNATEDELIRAVDRAIAREGHGNGGAAPVPAGMLIVTGTLLAAGVIYAATVLVRLLGHWLGGW